MRFRSVLVLAVLAISTALLGYACGGSSGSSDYVAKCKQVCEKEKTCNPAVAAIIGDCGTFCASNASGGSSGSATDACKDPAAASAKADQCLAMDCSKLETCFEEISAICGDSSGTGGASGATGGTSGTGGARTGGTSGATGGSSGATGGASGGADCNTACGKAYNCCVAYVPSLGQSTTTCDPIKPATLCADASTASAVATSCQDQLATYAKLPGAPAICK